MFRLQHRLQKLPKFITPDLLTNYLPFKNKKGFVIHVIWPGTFHHILFQQQNNANQIKMEIKHMHGFLFLFSIYN